MVSINLRDCSGHHAKVQVILEGMGIAGLALSTANLLFGLFESEFYFPAGALVFNNLFD